MKKKWKNYEKMGNFIKNIKLEIIFLSICFLIFLNIFKN